jgi:hypothetical protein
LDPDFIHKPASFLKTREIIWTFEIMELEVKKNKEVAPIVIEKK